MSMSNLIYLVQWQGKNCLCVCHNDRQLSGIGHHFKIFRSQVATGKKSLWVSYRSTTSRFSPFAFVELVSPYNKKNITRWFEEQYLIRSLRSLLKYCSCHSHIKFISSRHRVISSIYVTPVFNPKFSNIYNSLSFLLLFLLWMAQK